jgi:hypothetical protein
MPCSWIKLPGGGVAIVKHAPTRAPRCKFCYGSQPATQLCDFEIGRTLGGEAITCDAKVCVHCARRVGEKDFCPKHPK